MDMRQLVLRSLRYHSPTAEIRDSFTLSGNTIICTKPHLLNSSGNTSCAEPSSININSYVRKAATGGGRQRVKKHKRSSTQGLVTDQATADKPSGDFILKALQGVSRFRR